MPSHNTGGAGTVSNKAESFRRTSQNQSSGEDATVATPSMAYRRMLPDWALVADLMGGTRTMREAREERLPKFPNETNEAYNIRVGVAILFNAFRHTVSSLVGRVFSEPITFGDNTDERVLEWAKDIDLSGRDITAYGRDSLTDMIAFGISHTTPEMPNVDNLREQLQRQNTKADDARFKIRPYLAKVHPLELIGWRGARIGGADFLSQVRITEPTVEPVGDFGEQLVNRIRVIDASEVQIWIEDAEEGWKKDGQPVPHTLGEVNLRTGYGRRTGFLTATSTLMDLAWLNSHHWISSSDQQNILHVVRAALLFLQGFSEDEVKSVQIGPSSAIYHPSPPDQSAINYIEHSGEGIDAGRQDLQDTKEEMAVTGGGDLLIRRPGNETATARKIDHGDSISDLEAIALNLEDYLISSIKLMGKWIGVDDIDVELHVNTDIGSLSDVSKDIELMQKDADANRISTRVYLVEAQRRGLYDSEMDIDATIQEAQDTDDGLSDMPSLDDDEEVIEEEELEITE